jgi:hypothetical protein
LIGLLGAVLAIGGLVAPDAIQDHPLLNNILKYVVAAAFFAVVWLVSWIAMVYNSIVTLRQRVQQGWSNVDVQLKRRYDLIPNLVNAVQGMRGYEQKVQTELAHLRAQMMATPPGEPGPDPKAAKTTLAAIIEHYPELKANSSFMNLQQNLVDTEQRIALARGYFNDIASFYNARLQVVPDRFIAALGAMRPQTLLLADNFERAPVTVKLAT